MDAFFATHAYLMEHTDAPVRRLLMDDIKWDDRMIGIKGTRGVGKTTFLLQYAKEHFKPGDRRCLYVNMNNFYFQARGIADFTSEFYNGGGRVLLIDQVFKQPQWSKELRQCYDEFPLLNIIFTGSSVMRLNEDYPELKGIVGSYNLRGFSLREYLNLKKELRLPNYSLADLLRYHESIARDILGSVDVARHFNDYTHHGFYPFFLEHSNFAENLLKTMNMMTEVDILLIKGIEQKYLTKIKKLFYLLALDGPKTPNISQLANDIQTSRATVMNYIKYLAEARLINIIYHPGDEFPKKPAKVMMHNSNLMYAIYPIRFEYQDVMETFLVNALWKDHRVNEGSRSGSYVVDGDLLFRIGDAMMGQHKLPVSGSETRNYNILYNCDVGEKNNIPLWLFGFLY